MIKMDLNTLQSRTTVAAEQIIQLIREKKLQPGDRLPNEQELAALLNVGRSTLREAIRRLATRNILAVRQGSGTYVSDQMGVPEDPLGLTFIEKGPKLAKDLIELRLMIEPEMAAIAASKITLNQKKELIKRCDSVEQKINAKEYYVDDDALLHSYIAECSGNSVLQNLMPTIASSISIIIKETSDSFRARVNYEHRCIVDAICRGDSLGARYAMITHLNVTRDYFDQREHMAKVVWKEK
jgi:GntR family transcriptional repressor for pyruvate dehydrogenase complex